MIDIYYFFNSPDVASYCKKIGHKFSALDMAVIVRLSENKSLKIKKVAWQQIIDEQKDQKIVGNHNFEPKDSLHAYLKTLIAAPKIDSGYDDLADIYIDIPVPFKKGDLLEYNGTPCILRGLRMWDRINHHEHLRGVGDGSDMLADLYLFTDKGKLIWDLPAGIPLYYNLKYFDESKLEGKNKFLKYLSEYIKNGDGDSGYMINSIDWLINMYEKVRLECEISEHNEHLNWYVSEDKNKK